MFRFLLAIVLVVASGAFQIAPTRFARSAIKVSEIADATPQAHRKVARAKLDGDINYDLQWNYISKIC